MRRSPTRNCILIALVLAGLVLAQGEIVGGGYSVAYPGITAAPGQILTLFVRGITAKEAVAQSFPLPATLSGVTVATKVLCCNPKSYPSALPILKVHSEDFCNGRFIVRCPMTEITVQIPVEPLCVRTDSMSCWVGPAISLIVRTSGDQGSSGSTEGTSFPVTVIPTNPHFLNTCDTVSTGSGLCNWKVTHADGSPVTQANFAKPGETIVLYAVGLGFPDPSVPTGAAAKSPAYSLPTDAISMTVSFEEQFPPSSSPLPVTYLPAGKYFRPDLVDIVPGQVGLYQINFAVPQPPAQTHHCAGPNFADTNTRISFASSNSYVDVCVFVP